MRCCVILASGGRGCHCRVNLDEYIAVGSGSLVEIYGGNDGICVRLTDLIFMFKMQTANLTCDYKK